MQRSVQQAERVRLVRVFRGVGLKDLAGVAGVHDRTIFNLESGRFEGRPETVERVAKALEVPLEVLQDDDAFLVWMAGQMQRTAPAVPADRPVAPEVRQLVELLEGLPAERLQALLQVVRGLVGLTAK